MMGEDPEKSILQAHTPVSLDGGLHPAAAQKRNGNEKQQDDRCVSHGRNRPRCQVAHRLS